MSRTFSDRRRQAWVWASAWAALGLLHVVLAMSASSRLSLTYDETAHTTAGYTYWTQRDHRLQPENGWLPQSLIGLGLWAGGLEPPAAEGPWWRGSDVWTLSQSWIFGPTVTPGGVAFWGRLPIALAGGGLVVLIGFVAGRWFGPAGGLLAGASAAVSPTLLAHAGLATSDTVAAGLFLLAVLSYWAALHRLSPGRVAVCLAVSPLLALAKFSAPLVVPMLAGLLVVKVAVGSPAVYGWRGPWRRTRRRLPQAAWGAGLLGAMVVVAWLGLWPAYGFSGPSERGDFDHFFRSFLLENPRSTAAAQVLQLTDAGAFPEAYGYGFAYTLELSKQRSSFLNGRYSVTGHRWFFPYLFAVKTPLAVLAGLGIAGLAITQRRHWRRVGYRMMPLAALAVVYGGMALRSNLNIGHRHLLPIYPAMFILLGAVNCWRPWQHRTRRRGAGRRARAKGALPTTAGRWAGYAAGGVVWLGLAVSSAGVWPAYLSYFNPLDGGPTQAYRHVVDSSLDWGQDLPALSAWLAEHREDHGPSPVYLSYFGRSQPEAYGVSAIPLNLLGDGRSLAPLQPGVYAVSATQLQLVYSNARRWTPRLEEVYQKNLAAVARMREVENDAPALQAWVQEIGGVETLRKIVETYLVLREARLMQFLQQLEPDGQAGYSINVYHLDAAALEEALEGPPVQWVADRR